MNENKTLANYVPEDENYMYIGRAPQSEAEGIALYGAMNSPAHKIGDYINKTIEVSNIYITNAKMVDRITGEVTMLPHVVLIDKEGVGYSTNSTGVFNSIRKLVGIFGEPSIWTSPMTVEVKQISTGKGSMLSLELISCNGNAVNFGKS